MDFELVIAGLGTAVPQHRISQSDAAASAGLLTNATSAESRKLAVLYRATGVRTRGSVVLDSSTNAHPAEQTFYQPKRSVDDQGPLTSERMQRYERHAPDMAWEACEQALVQAQCPPRDITHLVTVSCSGFCAPGVDLSLITRLNLSPEVARTHVGFMGCHGALNGLRVAQAYAASDANAVVLLCAVELCTLHHYYGWHPERVVANALFADGAAAMVCRSRSSARESTPRLLASGACVIPDTEDLMSWRIGDHGFEMTLSSQVPEAIRRSLRPWLMRWLEGRGLGVDDVRSWAIHPGGPRILTAVAEAAGFHEDQLRTSREVLSEFGNMSSPTVLFILDSLWRKDVPGPTVALAFGPGLAIEAALFSRD